jgi:hypothetical protein
MEQTPKDPVHSFLRSLQVELEQIESERAKLSRRLEWMDQRARQIREALEKVEPLLEAPAEREPVEAGLTDNCRHILVNSPGPLRATEVRDLLVRKGVALDYPNPMSVLHAVLRRVGTMSKGPNGETLYEFGTHESRSAPQTIARVEGSKKRGPAR